MVASDTVIGVVGALLLAGVMVGVFVYEYNNVPEAQGGQGTSVTAFQAEYPTLNATADLDGDATANHLDGDFDGDGVDNANDTFVARVTPFDGTLAPATTSASSVDIPFLVQEGMEGLEVVLFYNTTTPAPNPLLPRLPALSLSVLDPSGESVAAGQGTQAGTAVTVRATAEEALAPGQYTLRITMAPPFPQPTPFEGRATVAYGAGHAAEGHGHA